MQFHATPPRDVPFLERQGPDIDQGPDICRGSPGLSLRSFGFSKCRPPLRRVAFGPRPTGLAGRR